MNFTLDLIVIAAYFVVIITIGLVKGRGEKTMEGFAMGSRQIPWWAVLASILAAEISAATFIGTPNEGFALRNYTYAQLAIGTIFARIIVSYIFIKPFYDYRVVSIYEFLRIRFGVTTRNAASGVFLLTRALASGTRLYVAAILLVLGYEMVTGSHPTEAQEIQIYVAALTFITVLTALYTAAGGIKAVVWTDVIQASVMFGAIGFAIYTLLHRIPGGWSAATAHLTQPVFWDWGISSKQGIWGNIKGVLESEYTIPCAILGSTFVTMATHGTDQDMVQRMLTAKNHHKSRLALILSGLADLPIVAAFLTIGILVYAFYQAHPDPELSIKNPFPYFILHELPPGVRGLLAAGLFATAMGSLSTALNALATSYTKDWYVPRHPDADEKHVIKAARWSTVVFAIILIVIGSLTAWARIQNPHARIIPIVLGIFGYTYGSLLGVFLVGMTTRTRGSERGNVIAMLIGFFVVAYLSGLHRDVILLVTGEKWEAPSWIPTIEFQWRVMFGTLATYLVAIGFRTPDSQVQEALKHISHQTSQA